MITQINLEAELEKYEQMRLQTIQHRINKFGETPEQAEDFVTKCEFALYSIAIKRGFALIKRLKTIHPIG